MFPLILCRKNANTLCDVKITFILSRSTKITYSVSSAVNCTLQRVVMQKASNFSVVCCCTIQQQKWQSCSLALLFILPGTCFCPSRSGKIKLFKLVFTNMRKGSVRELVRYSSGLLKPRACPIKPNNNCNQETEGRSGNRKV